MNLDKSKNMLFGKELKAFVEHVAEMLISVFDKVENIGTSLENVG